MKISPINNNCQKNKNHSFGMAVVAEKKTLEHIAKNLSKKDIDKFTKLAKSQKSNPIDINLSLIDRKHDIVFADRVIAKMENKNVLCANVSGEDFYSDDITSLKNPIIKLMEKATKYANKLYSVIFNFEQNVTLK